MANPTRQSLANIPVIRAAAAGAATLGVIYIACWVGTQVPGLTVSHMFLALFTSAEKASTAALTEGFGWALAFGAVSAGVIAFFYNRLAFLGPRTR